jgi:hypothetical protein
MSSAARKFGRALYEAVEEARGITSLLPTPRLNAERGQWVREAAAGQRSPEWEEVEEDEPFSAHAELNSAIRAGAGRGE